MKRFMISLLFICLAASSNAQNAGREKVVKAYYSGFETKDWDAVSNELADGFTFTSPNNDDHLSVQKFKEKCWGTAKYFKKVDYIKMAENDDYLMLLVQITTVDDKIVRNVDVFSFSNTGKIKSIEVFFGAGTKYPGNK
jgi:hypothetical protein